LHTIIREQGADITAVCEESGVRHSTIYNWFRGKTRRPQFAATIEVARALGHDLVLVKR
jgi:DNA-binding phage protein